MLTVRKNNKAVQIEEETEQDSNHKPIDILDPPGPSLYPFLSSLTYGKKNYE